MLLYRCPISTKRFANGAARSSAMSIRRTVTSERGDGTELLRQVMAHDASPKRLRVQDG
jgi:hypothetical protein